MSLDLYLEPRKALVVTIYHCSRCGVNLHTKGRLQGEAVECAGCGEWNQI